MKTLTTLLFALLFTTVFVTAAEFPAPKDDRHYGEDIGHWATHDGIAKATGPDQWTYINTSVWAELKMKNGMASEFLVKNCYAKSSIYISGATGTNQRNTGSGHMGQEVKPGQTISLPLGYQSKDHPITETPFTYKYWVPGVEKPEANKARPDADVREAARFSGRWQCVTVPENPVATYSASGTHVTNEDGRVGTYSNGKVSFPERHVDGRSVDGRDTFRLDLTESWTLQSNGNTMTQRATARGKNGEMIMIYRRVK